MKKKVLLLLAYILLASAMPFSAQTKRALIIGLGEQEDKSWAKINGDKDVPYVKAMLSKAGYDEITSLVNFQATKIGIVNAFHSLAARCCEGDVVYVHFSGHGQQVTDLDGDEEDGLDEAWIPYDAYLQYGESDKGEKHLIDDEINVLLTEIRNKIGEAGLMLVVVDACHSGDSSRGEDIMETVRGVFNVFVIPKTQKVERVEQGDEQWLTLSACKDYQLNQELKYPQMGKLTYAICSLVEEGNLSWRNIRVFMKRHRSRLPQVPVLTPETSDVELLKKILQ